MPSRLIRVLARILFCIAVPIAILTTFIIAMIYDADYYLRGELRQQVHLTSGLTQSELVEVNRGLVDFFSGREALSSTLERAGASPTVFNQKETIHLEDVRELIFGITTVRLIAGAYSVLFLVGAAMTARARALARVGRWLLVGCLATFVLVAIAGVFSVLDFNTLFLQFHLLSFRNDYWLLDPRTDMLIRMFPFGFWFEAALTLVMQTALTGLILGVVGGGLALLGRRHK